LGMSVLDYDGEFRNCTIVEDKIKINDWFVTFTFAGEYPLRLEFCKINLQTTDMSRDMIFSSSFSQQHFPDSLALH